MELEGSKVGYNKIPSEDNDLCNDSTVDSLKWKLRFTHSL